ncbi:MAG: universal stress protein [Spirosomataceae bacterium]
MKAILVPIDFSTNAQYAVNSAKLLARKTKAKIYLLHAYIPYLPTEIHVPVNAEIYADVEQSLKESFQRTLDEIRAEGIEAEAIWAEGPVLKAVVEQAEALGVDLVVIGRTGKGGFLDKLFGSVATDIVRNLEAAPVLTIPPEAELTRVDKIVYATRLEHDEEDAVRKVAAIAKALGAQLKFLKLESLIQLDIQPDDQFIEPLKAEFGFTDDDFIKVDIGRGKLVSEIERQALEMGADIVVVSKKEKGFIEELLVDPSISKKLLLNTNIPLMTCRLEGYNYST